MFMPIKFTTTVQLTPRELTNNYNDVIENKLKKNLENICSKHGFIKKNSIKIIKRSAGYFKEYHFNANIAFDLNCIAEICNPAQDSIIKCVVKAKNNLGLRAEGIYDDIVILEVIVPKITSGIQSEINIDTVNIGDEIQVKVCGKKFTLYDNVISIIGKIIKNTDENIVVVQQTEDDEIQIDDEIEVEDVLTEVDIDNEDEDEEDEDGIKKLDIIENNDAGKHELEDDEELEFKDDEDDDFDDEDFDDEDFDEIEDDHEFEIPDEP